jgi:hypothetical protein
MATPRKKREPVVETAAVETVSPEAEFPVGETPVIEETLQVDEALLVEPAGEEVVATVVLDTHVEADTDGEWVPRFTSGVPIGDFRTEVLQEALAAGEISEDTAHRLGVL